MRGERLRWVWVGALGTLVAGCGAPVDGSADPDVGEEGELEVRDPGAAGQEIRDGLPGTFQDVVLMEYYDGRAWQPMCTSTALRNDVVLTAEHCFVPAGPSGPPSFGIFWCEFNLIPEGTPQAPVQKDLRFRTLTGEVAFARDYAFAGGRDFPVDDFGCGFGTPDVVEETPDDTLVVRLATPLSMFNGDRNNHLREISHASTANMRGEMHLCVGYGHSVQDPEDDPGRGSGAGLQTWAGIPTAATASTHEAPGWLTYLVNESTENGAIQMHGDSGGPCFRFEGESGLLKVASVASHLDPFSVGSDPFDYTVHNPSADLFRTSVRSIMDGWEGTRSFSFSTMPAVDIEDPESPREGPSNWRVSGGVLREDSNVFSGSTSDANPEHLGTSLLIRGAVYANPNVKVTVRSTDNDAAGIYLRYWDSDNYYRASFDEERRYFRIVKRRFGRTSVLVQRTLTIDLAEWHVMSFRAYEGRLRARLSGPDLPSEGVELNVTDNAEDALRDGRIGLYDWGLANAQFDTLGVAPSPPF